MARWTKFYLVHIEFLGFRYCGWQMQPDVKTVEEMIVKTFKYIFKHDGFKVLGCGRTDAKVSADDFAFELFLNEEIDMPTMLTDLNKNLPFDIRAKSVEEVDAKFNVIQHSKVNNPRGKPRGIKTILAGNSISISCTPFLHLGS